MEFIPIKVIKKQNKFDIFNDLISKKKIKDGDILVISSKYLAISENSVICLDEIKPSKLALKISNKYHLNAKIAELILRESDYIFEGIPGFLLSIKNGIIAPNAGIDKSNIKHNSVVLYPKDPFLSAEILRKKFLYYHGLNIGIIISDSRLMPTRIGTTGIAIACSGIEPVDDQRAKKDLFGNVLKYTFKATADSLATIGVMIMGESDESTPVIIIRGFDFVSIDKIISWKDMAVEPQHDVYIRGLRNSTRLLNFLSP